VALYPQGLPQTAAVAAAGSARDTEC
jgi:hypothetical protein